MSAASANLVSVFDHYYEEASLDRFNDPPALVIGIVAAFLPAAAVLGFPLLVGRRRARYDVQN